MAGVPIPNTGTDGKSAVAVTYAYTIYSISREPIGTLQSFNPRSSRTTERIHEIRRRLRDTVELLPNRAEHSFTAERFQTYTQNILQAFGFVYTDLSQFTSPLIVVENLKIPEHIDDKTIGFLQRAAGFNSVIYFGCVPTEWSKTINVANTMITESVTFDVQEIISPTTVAGALRIGENLANIAGVNIF